MPVKIKICGIRSIIAAKEAAEAGADFLGFNFVTTSKRYIDPMKALEIIGIVKGKAKIVGVFQNADFNYVNKIAEDLGLDFVQLHGNEDGMYIKQIIIPVIKLIQIEENFDVVYSLMDRPQRKGKMVNYKKAAQIAAKTKLFYAGGLTPENVAEVVRKVRPYAVDVAGGIETESKVDVKKIELFIKNAKGVFI